MSDATPAAGHNMPPPPKPLTADEITAWLDAECSTLVSRRDELLAVLKRTVAEVKSIDDDEALAAVADNIVLVRKLEKVGDNRRTEVKDPFLSGGRAVDGWFKRVMQPLAEPTIAVQALMNDYGRRKDEAERQRRVAEAARARQEAERQAEEARRAMQRDDAERATSAFEQAAEQAAIAERAQQIADGKPAERTRAYSDRGTVVSQRVTWKARVTDAARIPRRFMVVDGAAIAAALRAAPKAPDGRPQIEIAGVEIYAETSMQAR